MGFPVLAKSALLAQLVERIHGKDEVTSSSLVEGSSPVLRERANH